ncbi:DUF3078 domain-containing protein [Polaribacter glomeratus]|uniref:DUF3078 domain-containing protein n=1 Tax=Polaribacter glomeratus TaxID=102 RepID=A0A2S7WFN1_9FLAO|nr:DUF3078 domain-containing protein [Polaribacter glomeratus]PQJ76439.1 hypothetical protein BTO16_11040 [Polaribacter glomeratus]TXD65573.1 DUF3078 domain-containing protein [Polaribacter glomeratus]
MKKLYILLLFIFIAFSTKAQTAQELKKTLASKKDSIAKLQVKAKAIQGKIDALPGWRKGAFGTVGASLSGFNNWYARSAPNTSAGNIGVTVNAFANLIQKDFFWRNSGTVNLGWVKIDNRDDPTDSDNFETATDVFTISSLYGKRLNQKWAISGLGEYRTTLLENFNDPGYLDIGAGLTWTPTDNLVVVIHPGNYNFVFSSGNSVFESSLGTKIVADYTAKYNKLSVKSNLSMFQSYKDNDLSNWTFTNSLGYTVWKGIGLGFELGLRKNKQEALSNSLITNPLENFNTVDNKLQSYWLFGVSYSI